MNGNIPVNQEYFSSEKVDSSLTERKLSNFTRVVNMGAHGLEGVHGPYLFATLSNQSTPTHLVYKHDKMCFENRQIGSPLDRTANKPGGVNIKLQNVGLQTVGRLCLGNTIQHQKHDIHDKNCGYFAV